MYYEVVIVVLVNLITNPNIAKTSELTVYFFIICLEGIVAGRVFVYVPCIYTIRRELQIMNPKKVSIYKIFDSSSKRFLVLYNELK